MANYQQDLDLATRRMARTTLERPRPSHHIQMLAAVNGLRKLDLDASPSVAEDSGPGQPNNNNNAGGLGSDDPQVSEETQAQELRAMDRSLAELEREHVAEGGGGGEEMVVEMAEKEARMEGGKRDWGGPAKKFSVPAPGYSRRAWGEMADWEKHRAWKAEEQKRKQRKAVARWGAQK